MTFLSPSWRSLNLPKGSLNHPKKVTKNCLALIKLCVHVSPSQLICLRIWHGIIWRRARSPRHKNVLQPLGSRLMLPTRFPGPGIFFRGSTVEMIGETERESPMRNTEKRKGSYRWKIPLEVGERLVKMGYFTPIYIPILISRWNSYNPLIHPLTIDPYFNHDIQVSRCS